MSAPMQKTWLVLKHELLTILRSKSFLFALFGLPLIGALLTWGVSLINQNPEVSQAARSLLVEATQFQREGYVDLGGLVKTVPADISADALRAYPDETSARAALAAGEIDAFYLIPAEYIGKGELIYIRPDFNPLSSTRQSSQMRYLLQTNLLGGDTTLAERVNKPLSLKIRPLAADKERDQDSLLTFFLPYGVTILFYMVILGSASLLLSSVTKEKENRIIEILMLSATPLQLLSGKILGLGLVGLLQTLVWGGISFTLLRLSGAMFSLPAAFQLPTSFLVWGLVFFVLGYALYSSLMAGIGALVPNMRESGQATFVVMMPMIVPMMLISVFVQDPNGLLSTILSIFPLTAPVAMMTRLSAGEVPVWQPWLAAALLAITAVFVIRAMAGLFRAQTLLAGQGFTLKRFFGALVGKV